MWGQTYYDVLQPALVNDNWKTSIENSLNYGMNKLRMHVYAQGYYRPNVEFSKYPDVQPYLNASKSPDREQLNIPYWRKLDEMIQYMCAKGMVADLIITNPYVDNRQFGTDQQNDRFVQYVVSRYGAYTNVIWCVANEWVNSVLYRGGHKQDKADFDRMGSLVRRHDPWIADGAFLRPLSIHNDSIGFDFFGSTWPTYAIIQYGAGNPDYTNGDQWGNAGIVHNLGHSMPVADDEYGYMGEIYPTPPTIRVNMTRTRLRGAIWGIVTAGGYGSAGDFRITPNGMGNAEITGDWNDAPEEYGDLKRTIDFFTTKHIKYWTMSSQNGLLTAGVRTYVLAEVGRQYVIYAAVGGAFSLNLAGGTYTASRFDPADGEEASLGTITGGAARTLSLPTDHDYVVYMTRNR